MRRTCLLFLGGLFLLLSACAPNPSDGTEDSRTQIVATTYPVYLFACEVTRGVPDCTVTLMIDQPIGCLHDYTHRKRYEGPGTGRHHRVQRRRPGGVHGKRLGDCGRYAPD